MSEAGTSEQGADAFGGGALPGAEFDLETLRSLVAQDPGCPEFPALAEAERRAGRAEVAQRISEEGLAQSPARLAGRVSLGLAMLDLGRHEEARLALAEILDPVLEPHRSDQDAAPAWSEPVAPSHAPTSLDDVTGAESEEEPSLDAVAPATPDASETLWSDQAEASQPAELASPLLAEAEPAAPVPSAFEGGLEEAELDHAFENAESRPDEMHSANRMAEQVLMDHAPVGDQGEIDELNEFADLAAADEDDEGDEGDDEGFSIGDASALRTETMAALLEKQGDVAGAAAIRNDLQRPAQGEAEAGWTTDAAEVPPASLSDLAGIEEGPADALDTPAGGATGRKSRILATLESWLDNLQRGSA
jgi:hypothetical protein